MPPIAFPNASRTVTVTVLVEPTVIVPGAAATEERDALGAPPFTEICADVTVARLAPENPSV